MIHIVKNGQRFLVNAIESYNPYMHRFWESVEDGSWEPYTFDILNEFLGKGTTYIDVGAWIGPTVMYAARLCDKCYALEPDPVAYRQLLSNIALNNIKNIVTLNEAIFDHDGTLTIGAQDLGNSMTRVGNADNSFSVICQTLESFVTKYDIVNPMFIKMDIEGAEEIVLREIAFFKKWKPTIYISLHEKWFRNPSDAMKTIWEVGALYKRHYDGRLQETNAKTHQGDGLIFTDI